ncbi:CAP domain-containing protein [Listeria sp. PSOL-1]|uniref:CAP domain-containing protein n=1 Tax=Listeria sp. PSOL-1 TaxID=1844999 RepID=UPI0013D1F1B6|nr:CAP domain-containing protein [Listeria sp. PSOL-1]
MKFILKVLVMLVICLFIGYNTDLFFQSPNEKNQAFEKIKQEDLAPTKKKTNESNRSMTSKTSISRFIDQDFKQFKAQFGEPVRIDKTPYGYDNYVYNQPNSSYMIVGVRDQKIQTVYALGEDLSLEPYKIGMSIEKVFTNAKLQSGIAFSYQNGFYRFELSEDDLNVRPIVNLGSGVYAQLNFDKFKSKLVSVRYLNKLAFIKMHPYELNYQGSLFEEKIDEAMWQKINKANDEQTLEITNVIRERYGAEELAYDNQVQQVAYNHSVDMMQNNYFDHQSKTYGSLSDRLKRAGVRYQLAGENIAHNYIDAGAVVEGWLNSPGHRKNLLDKKFTYMGEGTYQKYYTQNFITK